jgi:transporter family-2 protein
MTGLIPMILAALAAGACVSLSRSVNGRLSLSTSPMTASFWNHAVGLAAILIVATATGELIPPTLAQAPWWAWAGGPVGVIFIAAGSWLVARIGAAMTAMCVIAGQMVSGVALDALRGAGGSLALKLAGVALILAGVWVAQRARAKP